jgi:hypothetical protein
MPCLPNQAKANLGPTGLPYEALPGPGSPCLALSYRTTPAMPFSPSLVSLRYALLCRAAPPACPT